MQRANFQPRASKTIKRLCNHSNSSARFDGRDEAGDAVVFLDDLRRAVQWRKQAGNPCLMLWIVRKREGD